MRAFRTLLIAGVGMLAASSCTVTVSDGENDSAYSDDDLGFDDQSPFDSDGFDDTDTDATDTDVTDNMPTDDVPTDDVPTDGGTMTDDVPTDDVPTDDMPTDDMPTDDEMMTDDMPDGGMDECVAMPVDECDQCMAADCTQAYTLCACDPECSAAFDMLHACYVDKGYDLDNQPLSEDEYADCQAMSGEPGTLLHELVSCVEGPLEADSDDGMRFAGDGTCTMACYGMFSVEIVPFVED